jgi:molybdopterin-containing oxidoreductase family membrane subunit
VACVAAFVGIWIEKGMGLIIPGFVPSTLDQLVEYQPSLLEWQVTAGIWAFGLMIYTIALKIAIPVMRGKVNFAERRPAVDLATVDST